MPRPITITAKATLTSNQLIATLFRIVGVVPLRRVNDESQKRNSAPQDPSRNRGAFSEIQRILKNRGAVLIFPEGKSHNAASLEPLRTGLARLAIQARDEQKADGLQILPVGLIFDDKGTPGSVVSVRVGAPIEMDAWAGDDPLELTSEIARRLRSLSEEAVLPVTTPSVPGDSVPQRPPLVTIAAVWGRVTHKLPIRMARTLALRRSSDADQPAMLTMIFGIGLVLLTYVLQIALVGALVRSFWICSLYLASLLIGAYWAAFEKHPQHY